MRLLRPAQPGELARVLSLALASANLRAAGVREQVRAFESYIVATGCSWQGWFIEPGASGAAAGVFVLHLPGRVGVFMSTPLVGVAAAERSAIRQVLDEQRTRFAYLQALVQEDDALRVELVDSLGFRRLTSLVYYERSATYPWVDPPDDRVTWRTWSENERAAFERVVAESYVDSSDCPELTDVRPVSDVLASHRAAGVFDPEHWQLACSNGEPLACILLARTPLDSILEIVYVGVRPNARRQGLGTILMRRAMDQARRSGVRRVTVVVDERNVGARRLYESFAFVEVARRAAFWRRAEGEPA